MRYRAELFAGALVLGAALRIAALPLPGTTDVPIFKVWTYHATTDGVAGLYGTGGVFPERRLLEFDGVQTKVDYPPLALYELAAAGTLYSWANQRRFPDTPALTMAIKSLAVTADVGLLLLVFFTVRRRTGDITAAQRSALAVWLNPAVLLVGSVLGYLDPLFVLPAMGALVAGVAGRPVLAGALIAGACLTKPLGLFIAPAVARAVWTAGAPDGARRRMIRALAGAVIVGMAVVAPIAVHGGVWNMVWALGSLLRDPFLSGNAASVWRLVGHVAPGVALDLLRGIGTLATGVAIAWAFIRARGASDLWLLSALAAFCVHAYATLAVSVHENHLFAAVPLLALASAGRPRLTGVFVAVSAIAAVNVNLYYGLGVDVGYAIARTVGGIDIGFVLAIVNCAAFGWHAAVFARECALSPLLAAGSRR